MPLDLVAVCHWSGARAPRLGPVNTQSRGDPPLHLKFSLGHSTAYEPLASVLWTPLRALVRPQSSGFVCWLIYYSRPMNGSLSSLLLFLVQSDKSSFIGHEHEPLYCV